MKMTTRSLLGAALLLSACGVEGAMEATPPSAPSGGVEVASGGEKKPAEGVQGDPAFAGDVPPLQLDEAKPHTRGRLLADDEMNAMAATKEGEPTKTERARKQSMLNRSGWANYTIWVKTAGVAKAGTDANVYLTLGWQRPDFVTELSSEYNLDVDGRNDHEAGYWYDFYAADVDMAINRVFFRLTPAGTDPAWKVEQVVIYKYVDGYYQSSTTCNMNLWITSSTNWRGYGICN